LKTEIKKERKMGEEKRRRKRGMLDRNIEVTKF
jgi:hypothetical protein